MEYKYARNDNYEDFACGRVIYHMGGVPTFPVRLSLEIYERCLHYSKKQKDIRLYDCCCGGGYMLTVLGFLKNNTITEIYGSDIDTGYVKLANDNLSLLSGEGLQRRRKELGLLYEKYGKESHAQALQSLERLRQLPHSEIKTHIFSQDAFEMDDLPFIPDIIITDVPYGNLVEWNDESSSVNRLLEVLSGVCDTETILCVSMDKKQKIQTNLYQKLEQQIIGKRKFEIYQKKIYGTLACPKLYADQGRLDQWVQLFLRGDGKNIRLAEGLATNNFKYIGLVSIKLKDLSVSGELPEYITSLSDIDWFWQVTDNMIDAMKNGWEMPPLIVHYHDDGYYPLDGRHRIAALNRMGITKTMAVVVVNTDEDYMHICHKTDRME